MAQPYSQPPYLYSDISSSGNYNLTGKKFFVSFSTLNYNTIFRRDEYMSQRNAFVRYLVESLKLRGAVPVIDSLEADFYVAATLDYRNVSNDVTNYSKESKEFGTNSIKYNRRRGIDNIIEEENIMNENENNNVESNTSNKKLIKAIIPLVKDCPMSKKQAKYFNKIASLAGLNYFNITKSFL